MVVFHKNKDMKTLLALFLILLGAYASAQDQDQDKPVVEKKLPRFEKIRLSPKINLVLKKGEQESIHIDYANVAPEKIKIEVRRGKLLIYLDEAKIVDKRVKRYRHGSRVSMYHDAVITAYVTYTELTQLEMRGESDLSCDSAIVTDKFKLKVYGSNEVDLAYLKADKFKASFYGENVIKIRAGEAGHQVYRLFGENKIDTRGLESNTASARIYGEGRLRLKANDHVRLTSFGEPDIDISGPAHITKGIMIGRTSIRTH